MFCVCIQAKIQQSLMYALGQHTCANIHFVQSTSSISPAVSCREISQVHKVVQSILYAVISATLVDVG